MPKEDNYPKVSDFEIVHEKNVQERDTKIIQKEAYSLIRRVNGLKMRHSSGTVL